MSADAQHPTSHSPAGAASATETAEPAPALRATCWGTRGSIPSPGPATARYGGNTSCLEVRTRDDRCLIFDAGTGIRVLGRRLATDDAPVRAELFLSHFHWDHIQGMPFFAPLYDPRTHLRIHGAKQDGVDVQTLFAGQMTPVHFPIPFEALAATLEYSHLDAMPWEQDGIRVRAMRVRHPGSTFAYRIDAGGASIAYVPDNELVGAAYPVGDDWYPRFVEFLHGVDLLLHDAMFTDAEYADRIGWGHSTFRQAIELAGDADVGTLLFFHHAPERTDDELRAILDELRDDVARRGLGLRLGIAAEGEEHRAGAAAT